MPKDLRSFLESLENFGPDEFLKVKRPVNPNLELTGVVRKLQAENKFPAVLFENVLGTSIPVLTDVFASRVRLALAIGATASTLTEEYLNRSERLVPTETVSTGPVKDKVFIGNDADITKLPNIVHCGDDAGPYISSGMCIVKDPDTGIYNMGIYRIQIKGPRKLGIYPGEYTHMSHIRRKVEAKGEPLEVAIVVGHHPAVYLAAQYRGPFEVNELEVAGGLLGENLRVVKAETIDLEVPADAEIVIEGKLLPGVRELEGPFGEYTWYLGDAVENPVVEVMAITMRSQPIYLDIFSAHPDHNLCGMVAHEAFLLKKLKEAIPGVKNVAVPFSGTCRHSVYVSMKKEYDGQGRNAAITALAAHPFIKLAIIVDDDVDVFNESEVMWAVNTRVQPDRDIFIIPDSYVCELDPSAYSITDRTKRGALNAKWAIDATKPVGLPFQPRADVPREIWQDIDLEDYLR